MKQETNGSLYEEILNIRARIAEAYEQKDDSLLYSLSAWMDEIQRRHWAASASYSALEAQEG